MSIDAMRYWIHARGQFLPREHTLWDEAEKRVRTIYDTPECLREVSRTLINQLETTLLPFRENNVRIADIVVDGNFLMQVPDYVVPHVEKIFRDYIGMPDTHYNRKSLREEIRKVQRFLQENGLTAWPFPEPEPVLRIPMKLTVRTEGENKMTIPEIKKVIYSGSKTIIIWADGTKTITSCAEGEEYDEYYGFCSAVVKKLFGSTSAAKKAIKKVRVENKNKKEKENEGE